MIWRFLHPVWLLMAASGMSCASHSPIRNPQSAAGSPQSAIETWRSLIGKSALRNPESKIQNLKSKIINVAHRGARSLAPENTLAAARKAFQVGADAWEIDVHPTRDGRLVVMHDDTLDRTTNARKAFPDRKPWYVTDFTLDEIRTLDAGSWFGRDDPFGQIKAGAVSADEVKSYVGEKVPTLEEVLRFTRESGHLLDIEIKQMPRRYPDIVKKVVEAVEAENMVERVVISCFDHTCVAQIKSLNRKLMAGPISNDRVADPARYVKSIVRGDAWFASGQVVGAGSLAFSGSNTVPASYKAADLNGDDLRALRKAGVPVFVWTINDEPTMRGLIEAGVTGIVTDFPQRLVPLLR
jgi:glycerophosphoryl diester phosphodiesterase